jgi:SAM-dependent methyltransferase
MNCRICQVKAAPFLCIPTSELSEPFLDETLRAVLPELKLDRCPQCGSLWASDARQDKDLLLRIYARTPDSYFDSQVTDPRFTAFYQLLERLLFEHATGRRILDVGCGNGAFLKALSSAWSKWGLEPSRSGAQMAVARNLIVNCGTLETCPEPQQIDVLAALDVVEHLVNPHAFIESCKQRLAPGGLVLLVTGDADSWAARTAGSQWSYIRWCGHVSVFSGVSLQHLLRSHGFEILTWLRCDHPASPGGLAWWRVHLLEPVRGLFGRVQSWYPFWRDHQILIAQLR